MTVRYCDGYAKKRNFHCIKSFFFIFIKRNVIQVVPWMLRRIEHIHLGALISENLLDKIFFIVCLHIELTRKALIAIDNIHSGLEFIDATERRKLM